MKSAISKDTVEYTIGDGDGTSLNELIGTTVIIKFTGKIECVGCGRNIKKTYQQGYCFPCTQKLAACDLCVLSPDRCHYDKGTCREPSWGEEHCMVPHYLYISNTSGLKVGLTRTSQIPTRWIDQGAIQALKFAKVKTRYHAGVIEKIFASTISDRTNWRNMLKKEVDRVDLKSTLQELLKEHSEQLDLHRDVIEILEDESVVEIIYPYSEQPEKIKSIKLEKVLEFSSVLLGIKGQYMIFSDGVINMRSHSGLEVEMHII